MTWETAYVIFLLLYIGFVLGFKAGINWAMSEAIRTGNDLLKKGL